MDFANIIRKALFRLKPRNPFSLVAVNRIQNVRAFFGGWNCALFISRRRERLQSISGFGADIKIIRLLCWFQKSSLILTIVDEFASFVE